MKVDFHPPPIVLSTAGLALFGLLLVLLQWAAPVVTPIMLALYMAALAAPLYVWMTKRGWASGWALAALVGVIVVIFIGLGILLLLSADRLRTGLGVYGGQIADQLAVLEIDTVAGAGVESRIGGSLSGVLLFFVAAVAKVAGTLVFSTMVVALLLLEIPRLRNLFAGPLADKPIMSVLPTLADTAVQYFLIRTRLNVFTGFGAFLGFWLLGVDYAWLWAILVFALSYVPYIGLLVASVPPVILAFAEYGLVRALLVIVAVAVINVGIENILAPVYTGRGLNLSPLIVFVAFFFWAWLLGPVGALLAMPITVLMLLAFEQDERTGWLAQLIGSARMRPSG